MPLPSPTALAIFAAAHPANHERPRAYSIEDEEPRCAYCDCVEVAEAGGFCSDACADLAARDADADRRIDMESAP